MARSKYIYLVWDEHQEMIVAAFTVLHEARSAVARYFAQHGKRALSIKRLRDGWIQVHLDNLWSDVPLTDEDE